MTLPPTERPSAPVACNLCGSDDARTLHERGSSDASLARHALITTDVYADYGRIVRCRRCGLVYRNPRPSPEDVLSAYAEVRDADYLEEQDCRSMNAHLSLRVIRRHARGGRLLDAGCATGLFLNAARTDFDVQGVEPSAWAAGLARSRLGLDVVQGSLGSAPLPEGSFDVVTLIDVLEHFVDPLGALRRAAALLRPGGLLYVVTPDIGSLSSRLLRGYWWGLRPAHLYYFSRATLGRALEAAGFEVRESRSYGRLFTYGYWLSRLRQYPAVVYAPVRAAVGAFGVADKVVYINTRDSLEACAVRKPSA
jgi:SAM-dependent methyltransferase